MSTPEHRSGPGSRVDPRWVVAAAFLAGVLVASAVAAALAVRDDDASPASTAGAATPSASKTPSPRPSGSHQAGTHQPGTHQPSAQQPGSASPSVDAAEQQAQMTKPLADLVAGDRVVYNMVTCHFRSWVGSGQAVARIACPGEAPFQARTQLLVPVEAGGD